MSKKRPPWSDGKELYPGVFEKQRHDEDTGRTENIIYQEGGDEHFHGWLDPDRNQAGGERHENDESS